MGIDGNPLSAIPTTSKMRLLFSGIETITDHNIVFICIFCYENLLYFILSFLLHLPFDYYHSADIAK